MTAYAWYIHKGRNIPVRGETWANLSATLARLPYKDLAGLPVTVLP